MKRLTEKNESPCTCCGGIGSCRTDCSYKQIYDRLAEYEDTGLTPKEIEDMVSIREITPEAEYAIDKHANNLIQKLDELITKTDEKNELQRYKEAEEQGLLVRLPCKLGDSYFIIRKYCDEHGELPYATEHWGSDCLGCSEACNGEFRIKEGRFNDVAQIVTFAKSIGKTIFLTEEEAEKALEEMKNEA